MSLYHAKRCQKGSRCKDFRYCEYCARIRQKQIADVAERGANSSHHVSYAVIRTFEQSKIAEHKKSFMPRLRQLVDGGVWTIEDSEYSGLHMNIIAGSQQVITASDVAKAWGYRGDTDIHLETVPHNDVRHVAAYASKHGSVPDKSKYRGHVYGSFGTWKNPLGILAGNDRNPRLQIVAIEQLLAEAGIANEYDNGSEFARVCAVAAEKVDTDGFYILNGYGLITKDDLQERVGRVVKDEPPKQQEAVDMWFDPIKKEWYSGDRRIYKDDNAPKKVRGKPAPAPEWLADLIDSIDKK